MPFPRTITGRNGGGLPSRSRSHRVRQNPRDVPSMRGYGDRSRQRRLRLLLRVRSGRASPRPLLVVRARGVLPPGAPPTRRADPPTGAHELGAAHPANAAHRAPHHEPPLRAGPPSRLALPWAAAIPPGGERPSRGGVQPGVGRPCQPTKTHARVLARAAVLPSFLPPAGATALSRSRPPVRLRLRPPPLRWDSGRKGTGAPPPTWGTCRRWGRARSAPLRAPRRPQRAGHPPVPGDWARQTARPRSGPPGGPTRP